MTRKGDADAALGKVPAMPLDVKKRVLDYVELVRSKKASSQAATNFYA